MTSWRLCMYLAHSAFLLNMSSENHFCSKCPAVAESLRILQRW